MNLLSWEMLCLEKWFASNSMKRYWNLLLNRIFISNAKTSNPSFIGERQKISQLAMLERKNCFMKNESNLMAS